jgi:hypothetical protein
VVVCRRVATLGRAGDFIVAVEKVEVLLLDALAFVGLKERRLVKALWKLSIWTVLVLAVSDEKGLFE